MMVHWPGHVAMNWRQYNDDLMMWTYAAVAQV
jgi:hypothetical protein